MLLMREGHARIIRSSQDWRAEMEDSGLCWWMDPADSPHTLSLLPYPLPLEVGLWAHVKVEGLEYVLQDDGSEKEPTIHHLDANRLGCHFLPFKPNFEFGGVGVGKTGDIRNSLRVTAQQLVNIILVPVQIITKIFSSRIGSIKTSYLW